ncbi:MAG: PIN domain-containing protein [Acidobacteriota bacterium]|nr:PIN domain-containing protein [Acidobacteriota bacterium]
MRVLFDTDVVLDLVLDRQPFVLVAAELFELHEQGRIDIFVSAITPINVFYITRKNKGLDKARRAIDELLSSVMVCPIDQPILVKAQKTAFKDFEDSVQHTCAAESGLDAIVTRNLDDYEHATLPVFSPPDFLNKLQTESK